MKATVLVENNSLFCQYYNAEHGYSAWLEDENIKVLFDTGYSDNFLINAKKMGIDPRVADYVVISHGHIDHSGGLKYLIKYYQENAMYRKPILLMSMPEIMEPKYQFEWDYAVGMDVSMDVLKQYFDVRFSKEPVWLTKNLVFMGVTEITNDFERSAPQSAKVYRNGEWIEDYVIEDTQLAYRYKDGKDVSCFTACAHYGICNIMEYAKKLTGAKHVHTYLGGSHLRADEVGQNQILKTCEYVKNEQIDRFYICHDTDLPTVIQLGNACPVLEAGVSLVVNFDNM